MSLQLPHGHASLALSEAHHPESQMPAGRNSQFLHAGQIYVSVKSESIVLILGSCVAVCMWDPVSAMGGATHYLLPTWDGRGMPSARYGNVAILALLQKLVDAGASRERLRAKIFGGGCLFGFASELGGKKNDLGSRNVDVAIEILSKEKIPLISLEAGGDRGQRISFHTQTGDTTATRL